MVQKPGVAEVASDVPFLLVARPRPFLLGGSLVDGDCDCGGALVIAVRGIVCAVTGEFTLGSDVDGFGGVVIQIELNVVCHEQRMRGGKQWKGRYLQTSW